MAEKKKIEPNSCFTPFEKDVSQIALPERFTFPFYYSPHPLAEIAAEQLQNNHIIPNTWQHNFGLDPQKTGLVIGKMFGVLVVQNQDGQLGFLSAFSGKLANENHHKGFVPPLFDMLKEGSFFTVEEEVLNAINRKIEKLERSQQFAKLKTFLTSEKQKAEARLQEQRQKGSLAKKERKAIREKYGLEVPAQVEAKLKHESLCFKFYYKDLQNYWNIRIGFAQKKVNRYIKKIENLKEDRKVRSAALQAKLFDQYHFLNAKGQTQSLVNIFESTALRVPPAGAGECAAPKLLQYAFKHKLKPIVMAEFWWGKGPKSEIRKHKYFYPACKGKCEPILGHMLKGMSVDPNPMLMDQSEEQTLEILFEDQDIIVVNKPAEMLSVPGRNVSHSVISRIKSQRPQITPLVVHRLDMSTSGILLFAKNKPTHKHLQNQFLKRKIQKRYVALLEGILQKESGFIDLPLAGDYLNRPMQKVCFQTGKSSRTRFERIKIESNTTRIHFYPITGRTHQLRMHSAHQQGLNLPIKGDDLYGKKDKRLYLHAEHLSFEHPSTLKTIEISCPPEF